MKILVINFSDHGPMGGKVNRALMAGGEQDVTLVQMVDEIDIKEEIHSIKWIDRFDARHRKQMLQSYDKVIFCAHGLLGNTENCYTEVFGRREEPYYPVMDYQILADFIYHLFKKPFIKKSALSFEAVSSICYSARSNDHKVDHIENYETIDFKESFAYKLYQHLVSTYQNDGKALPIPARLLAYTGGVKFDERTGQVKVETEEIIRQKPILAAKGKLFDQYNEEIDSVAENSEEYYVLDKKIDSLVAELLKLKLFASRLPTNYGRVVFESDVNYSINIDTSNLEPPKEALLIDDYIDSSDELIDSCNLLGVK